MAGEVSNAWGRVADDGTVYVRTDDGERPIGSWQAGGLEEGLAHYGRRYDDLATEVGLLEQRLDSGAAEPREALGTIGRLRAGLPTAAVLGDLGALDRRLADLQAKADELVARRRAERAAASEQAAAAKQALVAEVERLAAEGTQWKTAGDRIRDVFAEWRQIRGVDRRTDAELWRRLTAARDAFTRRRGTHFAQLDQQRKESQARKEELVREAESLADSTEWAPTARRLRQLMNEWKDAGRASREVEQELWQRFRAAQDTFFSRRSADFAERDSELRGNLHRREDLVAQAETIDLADPRAAQARLRDLQQRYDTAGRVPREATVGLDARMRRAEQRVRDAVDSHWRRSGVESNPLLDQVREQVAKAQIQVERARAAGDPRALREAEAALAVRRRFLEQAERSAR